MRHMHHQPFAWSHLRKVHRISPAVHGQFRLANVTQNSLWPARELRWKRVAAVADQVGVESRVEWSREISYSYLHMNHIVISYSHASTHVYENRGRERERDRERESASERAGGRAGERGREGGRETHMHIDIYNIYRIILFPPLIALSLKIIWGRLMGGN